MQMITPRHNLSTLLVGVLLTALLLSCVLLTSILLTSCRTPRDTTATTSVQLTDLQKLTALSLFRVSLTDTFDFYDFQRDIAAHQRDTATKYPRCLVDPLPVRRIVRHAAMTAADTTSATITHDNNTREVNETKSKPAEGARTPFSFAFAIIAVVCFLGLVSCSFGVITYMILKSTGSVKFQ